MVKQHMASQDLDEPYVPSHLRLLNVLTCWPASGVSGPGDLRKLKVSMEVREFARPEKYRVSATLFLHQAV